jgi:hypothetical protein
MSITYRIDKATETIRTTCSGAVTIEEVIDHFRKLEKDPDCPDRLDVLLDLSEQTTIPESKNLEAVARAIERIRSKVQFGACAIIARTDALFGMLRMFEVFVEPYFRETSVFRTTCAAEAWLELVQRGPSAASGTGRAPHF